MHHVILGATIANIIALNLVMLGAIMPGALKYVYKKRQSVGNYPYFKNVSLLLKAIGANASSNNSFIDSSQNNVTVTRNGANPGMTQGTFSPYTQRGSVYFNLRP